MPDLTEAQRPVDARIMDALPGLAPQITEIKTEVLERIAEINQHPIPGDEFQVKLLQGSIAGLEGFFSPKTWASQKSIGDLNYLFVISIQRNFREGLQSEKNGVLYANLHRKIEALVSSYADIVNPNRKKDKTFFYLTKTGPLFKGDPVFVILILSQLNGGLKGFAGFELGGVEFRNGNFLGRISGVNANSGSPVRNAKLAKTGNINFVPAPQSFVDEVNKGVKHAFSLAVSNAQLGR